MKNNAKFIIMFLCIGLSAGLNGMRQQQQQSIDPSDIIGEEFDKYQTRAEEIAKNPFTTEGATYHWAKTVAERLNDHERVALIYQCYTLPINESANEAWFRGISSYGSAAARKVTGYATSAAQWAGYLPLAAGASVASGVATVAEPVARPFIKFGRAIQSAYATGLPEFDTFINKNKKTLLNPDGSLNPFSFKNAYDAAQRDFKNMSIPLASDLRTKSTAQIELLTNKIMTVLGSQKQELRLSIEKALFGLAGVQQTTTLQQPAAQGWWPSWGQQQPAPTRNFPGEAPASNQLPPRIEVPGSQQRIAQQQPANLYPAIQPPAYGGQYAATYPSAPQQFGQPQQNFNPAPAMQSGFDLNTHLNRMPQIATQQITKETSDWVDAFVTGAKQTGKTKNEAGNILKDAIAKKIVVPGNRKGAGSINSFKTGATNSVLDYFNAQW